MSAQMHPNESSCRQTHVSVQGLGLLFLWALAFMPLAAVADMPTLNVIGVAADGTQKPLTAYRWLVEEDKTYHVQVDTNGAAKSGSAGFDPNWEQGRDKLEDGVTDRPGGETLSVAFHRSYMPVRGKGCVNMPVEAACTKMPFADPDPAATNHYHVSVVPRGARTDTKGNPVPAYSIGGASFKDGDASVTVYVHETPVPTAQITVLVFNDNAPINNVEDLPTEQPGIGPGQTNMSGFQLIVEDAGGRYGASAGIMAHDAFGNPLGTTYDAGGNVTGFQPLITGPDGSLTIKNLAPGKYGVSAVPPLGDADLRPYGDFPGPGDIDRNGNGVLDNGGWQQTSTIEGTKVIDAWVKAKEPPYFAEFGPPGYHVSIGFVKPFNAIPAGGSTTISGKVVNQHLSRPPDYAFYDGTCFGHTTPWVGLNSATGGVAGEGLYAAATDGSCAFSIPNVPPGDYQLVVWDSALDLIFAFKGITIAADGTCNTLNGSCDLGNVPVFQWFHRQEHVVYNDLNGNGVQDPGEGPINDQTLNLRWRDGTVYQTNVTDFEGAYAFDQVFPFFSWLVAEVDFLRFQATGLETVVDDGGPINPGDPWSFEGLLTPQDQTNPPDPACADTTVCVETQTSRVDLGPVLLAGFQGFIGQTHVFQWGKRAYPPGENGGISGIVFYAVTRAENDPEYAAAEPWEPGIPNVPVNLYGLGTDGVPNTADDILLNTTVTDSWDDNIPTGCKHGNGATGPFVFKPDGEAGTHYPQDCYDGLRAFNQVRPAVFDGGYAFDAVCGTQDANGAFTPTALVNGSCPEPATMVSPVPPGDYVVQVVAPDGYEILKPEDKNVDFGDSYSPAPALLPPPCVGDGHIIPTYLTLFPDEQIPAPYAGTERPLCNKKQVKVASGANTAADFWLFTEVPIAAHAVGFILDDTQNEFDPNSPNFGEKYAPPFMPVTIRDWTGRVITRTLSDQYGLYNFLAPSTVTANLPQPSGMSPNMLTACMNDPGDDPNNPDPNWNQQYSTFCYTLQYMPGTTTYLDTPVLPVAAFAGPDQFPLDCEYADGTPRIHSVDVQTNGVGGGPYIPAVDPPGNRPLQVDGPQTITVTSLGAVSVPNPKYCNPAAGDCLAGATDVASKFVTRDFGFGHTQGTLEIGNLPVTVTSWTNSTITATVPGATLLGPLGGIGGRQLTVTRANGQSTEVGVTVQVGLRDGAKVVTVAPSTDPRATPITDAILANGTKSNDLILVGPGVYNEMVVMAKPVQLQGWGEGSTIINAVKAPADKLQAWRARVETLVASSAGYLVEGQEAGPGTPEPVTLFTEEGAGVLVLAASQGADVFDGNNSRNARVDGFTIKGADTGGGVVVNGHADYLSVSNNRIANNSGAFSGGIRVGHAQLTVADAEGNLRYSDADNDFVTIHHNQVVFNGGTDGAGGGISMYTGSDGYQVTDNWVCGNFTGGEGGGIAHYGRSDGIYQLIDPPGGGQNPDSYWTVNNTPLIEDNTVIFNESFLQAQTVSGGGILVAGAPPLVAGGLSPGSGNVVVDRNLIQGNAAGAGDGGGIRLAQVNGQDVAANPTNLLVGGATLPRPWYRVDLINNIVVNNVAALAGGGISLQDAVDVRIVHNTIANNDSLAIAGAAFNRSANQSSEQPGAGIVSRQHSPALAAIPGASVNAFSNPAAFADNIVWHNRKFFFLVGDGTPGDPGTAGVWGLCPDIGGTIANLVCPGGNDPVYDDMAVIPATSGTLTCDSCLTTGNTTDPLLVREYVNGDKSSVAQPEITTAIQAPPAFDEGGNFIRARFGPLSLYDDPNPNDPSVLPNSGTLFGDYHIQPDSPAVDEGVDLNATYPALANDFDGDTRPNGAGVDIGADELP